MKIKYLVSQSLFVIRFRYIKKVASYLRCNKLRLVGMKIGKNTVLSHCHLTWPHQVQLGNKCLIEHGVYFHYDGIYSEGPSIVIGNNVFVGNHTEFNIDQ